MTYFPLTKIADITQDQWGLVTRQQAYRAGVSQRTFGRLVAEASVLERVASGIYRFAGAPIPDLMPLRAAWLQLAPATFAWDRAASDGVVSHRSAGALYEVGHLAADAHAFTIPRRRQTRRPDVRLHTRVMRPDEVLTVQGLPATTPARTVSDLLWENEDLQAVAQLIADAVRVEFECPRRFADSLGPHAARYGLQKGDGLGLMQWLLDQLGGSESPPWLDEAKIQEPSTSVSGACP